MKFAQTLEDELVPEWRSRYLDYKLGKKKIKAITNPDHVKSNGFENESTPLMLTVSNNATGYETYLENPRFFNRRTQQVNSGLRKKLRRPSTISSILKLARISSNRNENPQSFELRDFFTNQKRSFLMWLDNQVGNIESFYTEKENEYTETFEDIQKQLYIFQFEKKNSPSLSNKYVGNNADGAIPVRSNISKKKKRRKKKKSNSNLRDPITAKIAKYGLRPIKSNNELSPKYYTADSSMTVSSKSNPCSPTKLFSNEHDNNHNNNTVYNSNDNQSISLKSVNSDYRSLYSIAESASLLKSENFDDLVTPINKVPLRLAKKQLKIAILEFYRSLELLRSYRLLNRTACQKIIKKFDKCTKSQEKERFLEKVNNLNFARGERLDKLSNDIEILYAKYFTKNDHKLAVGYLRSKKHFKEHYKPLFLGGLFVGISIPMVIFMITKYHDSGRNVVLMEAWGALLLPVIIALSFTLHFYVFTVFKINYKFIFDFNLNNALDFRQYILIPSLFLFVESVLGYFTFDGYLRTIQHFFPLFVIILTFIILFTPISILFKHARCWLGVTLTRLCAPLFLPVGFRDFFIADILCSLTYSFSGTYSYLCYLKNDYGTCTNNPRFVQQMGIAAGIPALIRCLQCLRRYKDSRDIHPHLFNALKFLITIIYYAITGYYKSDFNNNSYKAGFIFISSLNSVYSGIWDILFDWSLLSWNTTIINGSFRSLGFKNYKHVYYGAAVADFVLRFQWIGYVMPEPIKSSNITPFCIAIMELSRRFIWIFFRIENEHMSNVEKLRVTKDIKLPYVLQEKERRYSEDITSLPIPDTEEGPAPYGYVTTDQNTEALEIQQKKRKKGFFAKIVEAISTAHARDFERPKEDPNNRVLMDDSDAEDGEGGKDGHDSDSDNNADAEEDEEDTDENEESNTDEDGDLFEESDAIYEIMGEE